MRVKNGKVDDRAALAAYCRAEGLAMDIFECPRCGVILDWYGLPADKPEMLKCPACHFRVKMRESVAS
jgi:uncharacterized C2H2 Zn-finger protein